jgi:hypothetical protein
VKKGKVAAPEGCCGSLEIISNVFFISFSVFMNEN